MLHYYQLITAFLFNSILKPIHQSDLSTYKFKVPIITMAQLALINFTIISLYDGFASYVIFAITVAAITVISATTTMTAVTTIFATTISPAIPIIFTATTPSAVTTTTLVASDAGILTITPRLHKHSKFSIQPRI